MEHNYGFKVRSKALQRALGPLLLTGDDVKEVIVHHATDTSEGLQLEVELRFWDKDVLGLDRASFERCFVV